AIRNFPNHFLEQVLDGYYARGAAMLVHDHDELSLVPAHVSEDDIEPRRFRHEGHAAHHVVAERLAFYQQLENVANQHVADDSIEGIFVNGVAGMSGAARHPAHLVYGRAPAKTHDPHAWSHHLRSRQLTGLEQLREHVPRFGLQLTFLEAFFDDETQHFEAGRRRRRVAADAE